MKRWLIGILALLLLLSGCDGEPKPETTQTGPQQTATETTVPPGPSLYTPGSAMEENSGGSIRVFTPEGGSLMGWGFMGRDPVLFLATEEQTTEAVRIHGESGEILARNVLEGEGLNVWTGFAMTETRLACYDMGQDCVRIYDGQFRQTQMIPIPNPVSGSVLISSDLAEAYYTSGSELRALDLNTGVSRLVRQTEGSEIFLNWLLFDDTVACCYVSDPYESYEGFFSTADGRSLGQDSALYNIGSAGDRFLLRRTDGPVMELLLGTRDGALQSFRAEDTTVSFQLLPVSGRLAEHYEEEQGTRLVLYEPEQGYMEARILLKDVFQLYDLREDASGNLWFTAMDPVNRVDVLCCWDVSACEASDTVARIGKRYTAEDPDLEGLAQCRTRADALEERFGVDILLHREPIEPYDYAFTFEYQVSAIEDCLDALETAMEKFPEGFFETAASVTESGTFHISLVRAMEGTEFNTVTDAVGLQYWIEGDAYIALLSQSGLEQNFYHELSHALDTYVYANSIHYDFWADNNPKGFDYDYSYTEYENHWDSPYLEPETRAFIDSYSMTYPHEDRARVLEYAMTDGNADYFTTETMQAKLKQLCLGIRQAFGWKKCEGTFLWEQYLTESLAYTKEK